MGVFFASLRFTWVIFVILSIHSLPPNLHFDSGSVSFFHLYLTFLIISTIALLPFFISHHLTNNRFHNLLSILPLSFNCFFILIILFLTTLINPLPQLLFVYHHNIRIL
jgi:hypothetical protein